MQIMEILIYVVLFAALIGTMIDMVKGGVEVSNGTNTSGALRTIANLIPLMVVVGAFYYAYKKAQIGHGGK